MSRSQPCKPCVIALGGHRCAWPGCPATVGRSRWACPRHWQRLPLSLRKRLAAAIRWSLSNPGSFNSLYYRSSAEAVEWICLHTTDLDDG